MLTVLQEFARFSLELRVVCQTGLRARIRVTVKSKRPQILAALLDVLVGYVQELLTIV